MTEVDSYEPPRLGERIASPRTIKEASRMTGFVGAMALKCSFVSKVYGQRGRRARSAPSLVAGQSASADVYET